MSLRSGSVGAGDLGSVISFTSTNTHSSSNSRSSLPTSSARPQPQQLGTKVRKLGSCDFGLCHKTRGVYLYTAMWRRRGRRQCWRFRLRLVSWCFEPSQPQRITSGLMKTETVGVEKVCIHIMAEWWRCCLVPRVVKKFRSV